MDIGNIDRLVQSKELINGLIDIMVFISAVQQDTVIPVTVLEPFKTVLGKVYLLLEEIEQKERLDCEGKEESV